MTSIGKVRIYELSRDLGLESKDVLDAAEKLSIAARSHSSSISEAEASQIRQLVSGRKPATGATATAGPAGGKTILSVRKAAPETLQVRKPAAEAPSARRAAPPQTPSGSQQIRPGQGAPAAAAQPPRSSRPASPPQKGAPVRPVSRQPAATRPDRPASPQAPRTGSPRASTGSRPAPAPEERPASPARAAASRPIPARTVPNRPVLTRPTANTPTPRRPAGAAPGAPSQSGRPRTPGKPQLVGRPQPSRQPAPAPRPKGGTGRPSPVSRQGGPQRGSQPQRQPAPERPGAPTPAGSPRGQAPVRRPARSLELVGKPIRRQGDGAAGRTGSPSRPGGMPAGMRRPVAPGELMQLQKPGARTPVASPRRPGALVAAGASSGAGGPGGATPSASPASPPSPPRRPSHRPAAPGNAGRPRRPDWDDSARLEALRSRTPQRQRQKVHIIGENDDQLATQTGGFAGGQDSSVLQASLARPETPRGQQRVAGSKPVAALRKRRKETTRQRQRRRAMELRAAREAKQVRPEMLIVPEGNLTVQELADKLGVESSDIIKSLFFKGIIATVTQTLDLPSIEAVSEEFGVPVLEDDVEQAAKKTVEMIEESDLKHLIRRPPVVTVMGHVDHGKTSLLDAIRQTRVAAGEAGGITQHIGAYQVAVDHAGESRRITFLDTPGHEAFTAMRARGTRVTDVAVLVVAADDGVRPQTLEAISHARAAKVPIVVAINKIDKEGAQPDRVKQELSERELVAEEWGGDTVMVPVSAIRGENIDKLLEMILLVSEVEDLQANPDRLAKGTVIEAHLDKAKGPVATILVQNGTLKAGDVVAAGPVLGKVRAMVNDSGQRVKLSGPSSAVEALGFSEVPSAGDEFEVYPDEKTARSVVGERASEARATRLAQQMASRRVSLTALSGQASDGELKELNLILKADVQGSVEAILSALEQLPQGEVQVRVLLSAPGEITETDADLAAASGAVIVGFNTSMASGARRAADATGVDVRDYDVIYKLLEDIQLAMEGLLEPELVEEALGEAEVRAVFTIGKSAVAGCYITSGRVLRNAKVRVHRGKEIMFDGDLDSLRRGRDDVKEVATGFECGIGCDRFANWQEGDRIATYRLVTQRRSLSS